MPKHDPLIPASQRFLTISSHIIEHVVMDENEVCRDHKLADLRYDFLPSERVCELANIMTNLLADLAHLHTICKAGRANPKYWRGSRTARN